MKILLACFFSLGNLRSAREGATLALARGVTEHLGAEILAKRKKIAPRDGRIIIADLVGGAPAPLRLESHGKRRGGESRPSFFSLIEMLTKI